MAEYYVVRDKNTGLYFRGKGVNRWGKYYNQASIYRIRAHAENTIKEVAWRGEQAEVVPIRIFEDTADVAPRAEVAREIFEEIEELFRQHKEGGYYLNGVWFPERLDLYTEDALEELKKKYTEGQK